MMPPYEDNDDALDIPLEDPTVEEEEAFVYDEDQPNLVAAFEGHPDGQEALRKIAEFVITKTDDAWSDSEEYRNRLKEDNRLLVGELPEKDFPFRDAARLNLPILLENTMRLHARLFSEIFGDFTNVVGVVPVGAQDEETAQRISLHDNWQMREDVPDFQRQADRMLLMYLFGGDVTSHSYYDRVRRQNRHEMLTPDNFVVPYAYTSTFPDYDDCPFYTKILTYGRHELQRMRSEFDHVDDVIDRERAWDEDPEQPIAEAANESSGIVMPSGEDYHAPYKLYQFEGWCHLLPGQEDDRFIQAVVDPVTRHVMRLTIHEEESWKDRVKRREMQAELEQYNRAREAVRIQREMRDAKIAQLQASRPADLGPDGGVAAMQQAATPIPDPEPPAWMTDPENPPLSPPVGVKRPIRMFAHGVNIEPLRGCLGIGYGRILSDFSRAGTTMLNQHIDAATLQNAPPMLSSLKIAEDLQTRPGLITPVDATVEDLSKSIFVVPTPAPSPALMQGVEFVTALAQQTVQAPSVLSGEPGKSGETYRGIASRIEQATKQLSTSGRKFTSFLRQIYVNNARLNSMYLDEIATKRIFNANAREYVDVTIARQMYERDYRVEIRADLKFTPEAQKKQEAMERLTLVMQSPLLAQNQRLVYEATVELLKASDKEDWVPLLGSPPPPPQQFGGPPPGMPGQEVPGQGPPPQGPPMG